MVYLEKYNLMTIAKSFTIDNQSYILMLTHQILVKYKLDNSNRRRLDRI